VLGFAVAVNVPVASKGPAIFNVPFVEFIHLEVVSAAVIPVAEVDVMVPLLVTVTAVNADPIVILPAIVKFAVDRMVLLPPLIVNVPVLAIVPVPSIVLFVPDNVTAPVPEIVPLTITLPEAVSVRVPTLSVPRLTFNVPVFTVVFPARLAVPAVLLIVKL
jgi:hypothetical protein